jgi:hypothetical protein
MGLQAAGYDINRIPGTTDVPKSKTSENIISQEGFENAVALVMRCSGLLWMAPVCSSWIFCNMSNTKRSKNNVQGDVSYGPVRDGNLMADVAGFLMCLAWRRGLSAVIENPASSLIFKYPNVQDVLSSFGAHFCVTPRCSFSKEPLGQRYYKLYKFAAVGPHSSSAPGAWIAAAARTCTCPAKKHIQLMHKSKDGKVTGRQEHLTKSAAYPLALGDCIVHAWQSTAQAGQPHCSQPAQATPAAGRPPWLCPDDDSKSEKSTKSGDEPQKPQEYKTSHTASWLQPADDDTDNGSDVDSLAASTIKWGRPRSDDECDNEQGVASWLQPAGDDDEMDDIEEPVCKSPPKKMAKVIWNRPGY